MNRAITGLFGALMIMMCPTQAPAAECEPDEVCPDAGGSALSKMELTGIFAVGGSVNARIGYPLMLRLRYLNGIPFALEANVFVPYGGGAGVLLDVYRGEHLRVHAFDLGIFAPIIPQFRLTRPDVDRKFDIWTGLGLEWNYRRNETVAVDWRVYLADPTRIPFYYGSFCKPIYLDALKESQLWIGYVKRF